MIIISVQKAASHPERDTTKKVFITADLSMQTWDAATQSVKLKNASYSVTLKVKRGERGELA
jgi:hypothetical protein